MTSELSINKKVWEKKMMVNLVVGVGSVLWIQSHVVKCSCWLVVTHFQRRQGLCRCSYLCMQQSALSPPSLRVSLILFFLPSSLSFMFQLKCLILKEVFADLLDSVILRFYSTSVCLIFLYSK